MAIGFVRALVLTTLQKLRSRQIRSAHDHDLQTFQALVKASGSDLQSDEETVIDSEEEQEGYGENGNGATNENPEVIKPSGKKTLKVKMIAWRNPKLTTLLHFLDVIGEEKDKTSHRKVKAQRKPSPKSRQERFYVPIVAWRKMPINKHPCCFSPMALEEAEEDGYLNELRLLPAYPTKLPEMAYYDSRMAKYGSASAQAAWKKHKKTCRVCRLQIPVQESTERVANAGN
jgi:hypothetical protein